MATRLETAVEAQQAGDPKVIGVLVLASLYQSARKCRPMLFDMLFSSSRLAADSPLRIPGISQSYLAQQDT